MSIYNIGEIYERRRYLKGGLAPYERKRCSCGVMPDTPEHRLKYVRLDQGSFVSNIFWYRLFTPHVIEELMNAFQSEGFEGLAFEPTEIVADKRPSKDRKKLPLNQIPQFYRVKCLTSIPLHPDYIERRGITYCPECGAVQTSVRYTIDDVNKPIILDGNRDPKTDFFRVERFGASIVCTERGKAFLESYPKTYCRFTQCELR